MLSETAKSMLESCSVENDHRDAFLHSVMARSYLAVWMIVEVALLL